MVQAAAGIVCETVAVDNTDENKPVFFTTEDTSNGELRRFEADDKWLGCIACRWTYDAEGIISHNSTLYFVAKVTRTLFILDLTDDIYFRADIHRIKLGWPGFLQLSARDQIIII